MRSVSCAFRVDISIVMDGPRDETIRKRAAHIIKLLVLVPTQEVRIVMPALTVNGKSVTVSVRADTPILWSDEVRRCGTYERIRAAIKAAAQEV